MSQLLLICANILTRFEICNGPHQNIFSGGPVEPISAQYAKQISLHLSRPKLAGLILSPRSSVLLTITKVVLRLDQVVDYRAFFFVWCLWGRVHSPNRALDPYALCISGGGTFGARKCLFGFLSTLMAWTLTVLSLSIGICKVYDTSHNAVETRHQ